MEYRYNSWAHAILTTPGSQLPEQKLLDEMYEDLMQEVNCWRMYGYLIEFVMDEIIMTQVN